MLIDIIPQSGIYRNLIQNENGIFVTFDSIRSKWLSIYRNSFEFIINHNHLKYNQWMMYNNVWSNLQGYDVNRNMTITLISVHTRNISNGTFKIINDDNIVYIIKLNDEPKKIIDNLNIDIDLNTSIKVLMEVNEGGINNPTVKIEHAWR